MLENDLLRLRIYINLTKAESYYNPDEKRAFRKRSSPLVGLSSHTCQYKIEVNGVENEAE